MSKLNTEEKKLKIRKLSLNRETLRILSGEQLEEVAGGAWFSRHCSQTVCPYTF